MHLQLQLKLCHVGVHDEPGGEYDEPGGEYVWIWQRQPELLWWNSDAATPVLQQEGQRQLLRSQLLHSQA